MTPWVRTTQWVVFWATLIVSLLVGLFVAWVLSEVLPPGTVITVDDERFVLPAFTHFGHWLTAVVGVMIASAVIVVVVPLIAVLAFVVPIALGTLGLLAGLLAAGLVLWPVVLLVRWLWKGRASKATIAA